MLEEMALFFDNRLIGYDEHMMTAIEGAAEQKLSLYKKLFNSLKAGGYFILTDYFAESEALERKYFENLRQLKSEQGITDGRFYHYDTPLTIDHEMRILKSAGFSQCEILKNWGATYTVKAVK